MHPSEQRRKRKHVFLRPKFLPQSPTSLLLSFSFFILCLFLLRSSSPLRRSSTPTTGITIIPLRIHHRILFPDHVLLTLSNPTPHAPTNLECVYYNINLLNDTLQPEPVFDVHVKPVLSTDRFNEFHSLARCPLPPTNFSAVDLRRRYESGRRSFNSLANETVLSWHNLAYEAVLDGDSYTVVVFVKGLNLRPHRVYDPAQFKCHFGFSGSAQDGAFWETTVAVSVAQEVVRCGLPQRIRSNPEMARGASVTVSHVSGHVRPSVARVRTYNNNIPVNGEKKVKHELCACTMLWNKAHAMREWVMYHSWLGVERWFIYDNNSDDDVDEVVRDLETKGYNVSRETWPWVKSQEAGFSHCALRAREECKWVGFFDVDEFFYFPNGVVGKNSLRSLVANFSSSDESVAEIRTECYSFGPSGLSSHPKKGVTVGYTCRLQKPERHKSFVRPDSLDVSLLNAVHHFELKEGFRSRNVRMGTAVINHYKYQVWETFKAKFYRRAATYVVDWHEDKNRGSKDRAPGLGTEAIEPPNWRFQFCEVRDTGLKDFVLSNFADPATGLVPWERGVI